MRNRTRDLLDRVAAGEEITITVNGRAVAALVPVRQRRQWMGRDEFLRRLVGSQADAQLTHDLVALAGETTDELGFA